MKYIIDNATNIPAYLQLYKQVREDIVKGIYSFGSKLPSKRIIAVEAGISTVTVEHAYALLYDEGYIEAKERRSGKFLISFDLYDGTSTITCKAFLNKENAKKTMKRIQSAKGIKVAGTAGMDTFSNELTVMANTIIETEGLKKTTRQDNAEIKRVELHMHTQMSQMDAMTSAKDLIKRAMKWGMKSIAITDHGVVQAFPEAHKMLRI